MEGRRQRLAACDESPAPSAAVAVVFLFVLVGALGQDPLDNLLDVTNLDEDVFGLEVGVDDAAFAVQVVQAQQHLLGDLLDQRHGDAAVVPALDEAQQVLAQHLEHHAHVGAVGALVLKRVQQADDVLAAGVVGIGLDNLIEQLDLVDGRLGVVRGGPHHLERNVFAVAVVARQPHGREVAPSQLAHHRVPAVLEVLANLDGMVAALAVVFGILLVGRVLGGVVGRGR